MISGLTFSRSDFQQAFDNAKSQSKMSTALKVAADQRVIHTMKQF